MPDAINKAMVTSCSALKKKYGAKLADVQQALQQLVAADAARGLKTAVIDLSSAAEMKTFGVAAASSVRTAKPFKVAIDAVYRKLTPDYLLILGSVDVVPHQPLNNPTGDDDPAVPSDLPYACERAYSRRISDFLGPTRVVGRLPDITGATDPNYLMGVLGRVVGYQSRPRADYDDYLGISAKVWQASTAMSLKNTFGNSSDLQTAPPKGPVWPTAWLRRRAHFINCHGAPADPQFYGQSGNHYPPAHASAKIAGKITDGTIVAAECCYGGELYNPTLAGGVVGLCQEYLRSGAYGFLGSTTIAYGPAAGNAEADVLTQDFLKHLLAGASLGRAALQARQDYVLKNSVMDPVDLKTLAQFLLLGDPSVHPVQKAASEPATPTGAVSTPAKVRSKMRGLAEGLAAGRALRREALLKNGLALATATNFAQTVAARLVKKAVSAVHRQLAEALGEVEEVVGFESLDVFVPKAAGFLTKAFPLPKLAGPTRVHFAVGRRKSAEAPCDQFVVVVARECAGVVSDMRTVVSR